MMRIRLLFLSLLLLSFFTISAQSRKIQGSIKDARSGEELIGAIVHLKEYPKIHALTGLDGSFELKAVPQGALTVVCRYIGYYETEKKISVGMTVVDLKMQSNEQHIGELEVVGKAVKNNDLSARLLERNSNQVMNVVSAKSIELSPDLNVASVLQRMSGVTLERNSSGDGQYAVLRGMDKRYNYSLINGVKVPSPDNKQRYLPLDIIPSELLDRLEVTKSLTADMEGDASGGVVNMVLKDAPHRLLVQANLSIGYNQSLFNDPFLSYNYQDRMRVSPREQQGANYSAQTGDFNKSTLQTSQWQALPNGIGGFAIGNRFLNQRLGVIVAGSYQNIYRRSLGDFFNDEMKMTVPMELLVVKGDQRAYSERKQQVGLHAKIDYKLNNKHSFEWYNAYFNNLSIQRREITSIDFKRAYDEVNQCWTDETYQSRMRTTAQQIFTSSLQGDHLFIDRLSLKWSLSASTAGNDRPDNTYVTLQNLRTNGVDDIRASSIVRRWEHNSDNDLTGQAGLSYPVELFDQIITLQVGGLFRNKQRENFYVQYSFGAPGTNRPKLGTDFNTFDEIPFILTTPQGSVNPLNYEAEEMIGAGYFQAKWESGWGHLLAGVRAEHTDQSYYAYYPSPDRGEQKYLDLLPSVHYKYKLKRDMSLRASYFRSINRPGFFEIVPYTIVNEDYQEYGNKDLKRAKIDNLDLRWEYFPKNNEQIMVGIFYKHIQDPIEYAYFTKNYRQYGYGPMNLGTADNWGVEVDFIKYFHFFGVKANYTYTHSAITTPKNYYDRNPQTGLYRAESSQTRPLVGQAAHVANLSAMLKLPKSGWDAQLAASYTGDKIVVASHFWGMDHWQKGAVQLDASVEKRFKVGASIFLKASNLLNTPSVVVIKQANIANNGLPMQSSNKETLISKDYYGPSFLLGVRYKFEK